MLWTAPSISRDDFSLDLPERRALEAFVTHHRRTLLRKCQGLTGKQLAARPIPSTAMSLLGIIRHMAQVERHWWRHRVAGEDVPDLHVDDAEWGLLDGTTAPADYMQPIDEWSLVDAVAARYDLDDTFIRRDEVWSVRTLYLHLPVSMSRSPPGFGKAVRLSGYNTKPVTFPSTSHRCRDRHAGARPDDRDPDIRSGDA